MAPIDVKIKFEPSSASAPRRKMVIFVADKNADLVLADAEAVPLTYDKLTWTGRFDRAGALDGLISAIAWEFSEAGSLTVALTDTASGWTFTKKIPGIVKDKAFGTFVAVPA
jgi:hypothetical protein